MKNRVVSLDFLRFLGPILITNSHFDSIYPMPIFATGGAIGDAIFFFISGYTLNYSSNLHSFSLWYKTRLTRIFPTVFAVAILHEIFFDINKSLLSTIFSAGGWFVRCILIYYLVFFLIKKLIPNYTKLILSIVFFISVLYIILAETQFSIWGGHTLSIFIFFYPFCWV